MKPDAWIANPSGAHHAHRVTQERFHILFGAVIEDDAKLRFVAFHQRECCVDRLEIHLFARLFEVHALELADLRRIGGTDLESVPEPRPSSEEALFEHVGPNPLASLRVAQPLQECLGAA